MQKFLSSCGQNEYKHGKSQRKLCKNDFSWNSFFKKRFSWDYAYQSFTHNREWNNATSAAEKRVHWCSCSCLGGTYTNTYTHLHSRLDLYVLPTHQAGAWEKEGCVVASLVFNYTPATLRYISSDVDVSVHARDSIRLVCNDVRQVKTVHLVACWAKLLQEYFTACLLLSKLQQDALLQFFML